MQSSSRANAKPAGSGPAPSRAEKNRLETMRKATPDFDALTSDDDEHDIPRIAPTASNANPTQPHLLSQRRTSWLSEIQSGFPPRRPSLAATASNTSQPATPSVEPAAWPIGIPLGRVSSNPTSNTWSSAAGVWGSKDSQRGPASRYLDIASPVQSRAFAEPPSFSPGEPSTAAASHKTQSADLPFNIPLHPTLKTYRSQSYSVGQTEADIAQNAPAQSLLAAAPSSVGRQRFMSAQGSLWHRPCRPSMLSEVHQGSNMSALHEENDDLETVHDQNVTRMAALAADSLADEDPESNPIAANPAQVSRHRDEDRSSDPDSTGHLTRRFSELAGLGTHQTDGPGSHRRSPWQTSLGFGELSDLPQSRRHSMAQVPSHGIAYHLADSVGRLPRGHQHGPSNEYLPPLETGPRNQSRIDLIDEYGISPTSSARYDHIPGPPNAHQYSMLGHVAHQNQQLQGAFPRSSQDTRLYLVTFKNARADVYFVAPNTGLQVGVGDDVIVEADRGHDLGTVQYAGLTWAQARELKQKSNDEHFRILMAGSLHPKNAAAGQVIDNSGGGGKFGGSDMPIGDNGHGAGADLKPKMIKRLAQGHETATRRDKESNEAKARRICQQKVMEHGLDMEILDAEFQMDWKKLTFCYYAHSYVNFNILVTELFKVYKTRIWMSAVNPASLSSPIGGGRTSAFDSGSMHRGPPVDGLHQDLDPTGAVPPNMNPSTNAFYEYAYATRQAMSNTTNAPFVPGPHSHMFSPVAQTEYATQSGISYWSEAPNTHMASSLPKTRPQYNATAASYSPAFQQRPVSRDRHSASPSSYQSFGNPIGRPIPGDALEPADT